MDFFAGLADAGPFPTAFVAFLVAGAFFVIASARDPLHTIPGPLLARLSKLWLIKHARAGDMHRVSISLHEKHGKLVRTGPNEVSISDLTAIKTIYGPGSKFRKSDWYSVWQGHRNFDLFAERDERVHGSQRRLISHIYSLKSLTGLEGHVDDVVRVFLSKVSDMAGRAIDMNLWAQLFAFDVVGEMTFSKRFGFMDRGADDGSFEQIDGALRSAAWIGQIPWLYWLHDYLAPYIGNRLGITARHGTLRAFAASEVEARKSRGSESRDILAQLNDVHETKPTEFDNTAVLSMVTSNIFAGSDTTAISICSVLYHLCKFPDTKAILMDEIRSVRDAGLLKSQSGEKLTGKMLDAALPLDVAMTRMPYLQACIYEALRLHPAVGMTLPRVAPEEGIVIDGAWIPGGTVVGANPWVIHRNKEIFGDDVDIFRPERWIKGDEETLGNMERYFFAFGAGARTCLGRNLSWIEMSKLVPLLLLNFDMNLAHGASRDWEESCYWFVKQKGLIVQLTAHA